MPLWVKIVWTMVLFSNIVTAICGASPTWTGTFMPLGALVLLLWTM